MKDNTSQIDNPINALKKATILDSVPHAIVCLKGTRIVFANHAVQNIFGWKHSELVGQDCGVLYNSGELMSFSNKETNCLFQGQEPFVLEIACTHKKGFDVMCEVSITSVEDNSSTAMIIISHQDITKRKQVQDALRESEEKYRDFFVNVSDFLYVHDLNGKFIETNLASKIDTGYSEEDLSMMNIMDFLPSKYKPLFKDYLARIRENGKDEGLVRLVAKDGSEHIIEYRNSLIQNSQGNPIAVRGSARDITEYIHDKKALKKSEEKYRTILENLQDGYYEVDLLGNFTFFNDSMCSILGYSKEELMGMNNRKFMNRENAGKVFDTFKRVYRSGKPEKAFDWEVTRKNGSTRFLETSVTLIKDLNNQIIGFRGLARDITERKKAEKEKIRLEKKLNQAHKMEAIGTLAGGVAHDLNNILSGLVSYPELILMDLDEDDVLRKPITTIQQSGAKAAAIVQDLLTLARRGVSTTEVTSLYTILIEYLKSPEFSKLVEDHKNIEVNIDCADDLLPVIGSPFHLSKVIMNLVTNAAEAMTDGGTITISAKNIYLDRPIRGYEKVRDGRYVVLNVSDTGSGISPDDRDKIFEPFYTKKVMGRSGTGLGMTVVWGTVSDHNGYIDVQSREGKGTKFSIYLPATTEEIKGNVVSGSEDYRGNGEKIMVVDDVEVQRDIALKMLKKLGYRAIAFSSGEEAVEYLKGNSTDLIILDMIMDPGIDGLETYRRILEIHPSQKVIIASGYSETGRVKEVQKLGAGAYIKKPYLLETIARAVVEELMK